MSYKKMSDEDLCNNLKNLIKDNMSKKIDTFSKDDLEKLKNTNKDAKAISDELNNRGLSVYDCVRK